jgi:hypothetical protein
MCRSALTFCELQVWIDHPEKDPVGFATDETRS